MPETLLLSVPALALVGPALALGAVEAPHMLQLKVCLVIEVVHAGLSVLEHLTTA